MACPVCQSECESQPAPGFSKLVTCVRCGKYLLTSEANDILPAKIEEFPALPSVLSHFIRRLQTGRAFPQITDDIIDAVSKEGRRPPGEQLDSLIQWIGDNQPSPFELTKTHPAEVAAAICADKSRGSGRGDAEDGLQWLIVQTVGEKLYFYQESTKEIRFSLTMKGWERYQELKRRIEDSRTAFMAMKFNEDELQQLVDKHFRPAVTLAGFDLRLVTDKQSAGLIDNQIRVAIRTSAFVVADLTHGNNGAYFEAGFAEGIGLPVIYTCRADVFKEKKTHFDTNHMLTVPWDPADPSSAANRLKETIRNTLPTKAKMTD